MTAFGAKFSSDEVTYGPSCADLLARAFNLWKRAPTNGEMGRRPAVTSGEGPDQCPAVYPRSCSRLSHHLQLDEPCQN
jgi:hypothetical protein